LTLNMAPLMALVVTNTGKTPAMKIAGNYYVEVVDTGQAPNFEAFVAHMKTIQFTMIPPNGAHEELIQRWRHKVGMPVDYGEPNPLTNNEKKALEDGRAYLAVHGLIQYGDAFNKRHWVRFCYWDYFSSGYFDAPECDRHNSAGDE
jgi:hypothetical protein